MDRKHARASLLAEGKDIATCPICMLMLALPTSGCPEGHAFCRECYLNWLEKEKSCPTCRYETDASKYMPLSSGTPRLGRHGPQGSRCL